MIGLICGTNLSQLEHFPTFTKQKVTTQYGQPSADLIKAQVSGVDFVFLPRHGSDAGIAPHLINYRANIRALAKQGVRKIVTLNTVGSTNPNFPPGSWVLPDQLIDYTYGREHTFFDGVHNALQHIDFTHPFSLTLSEQIAAVASSLNMNIHRGGCYACTQGPRLETAAEVKRLKADGNDLIGMTAMPEANLARELGIDYVPLCLVANWGAGVEDAGKILDIDDIYSLVKKEFNKILSVVLQLIGELEETSQ
jgi:5'-methylthioinosine phosphorylase